MSYYLQNNCDAAGDDEEMINYEWPWFVLVISIKILLIMVQPILYLSEF